jgi:hypothetical protein
MIQYLWEVWVEAEETIEHVAYTTVCVGCEVRAAAKDNFNALHVTAHPDGRTPTCEINS